jgi:hypothetical protein
MENQNVFSHIQHLIDFVKGINTYGYFYAIIGEHYVTAKRMTNINDAKETISIFSRGIIEIN